MLSVVSSPWSVAIRAWSIELNHFGLLISICEIGIVPSVVCPLWSARCLLLANTGPVPLAASFRGGPPLEQSDSQP